MVIGRRRSRLPRSIQIELIKYFVGGSTAHSASALTGVNRHTATLYFHELRELIAEQIDADTPELMASEIKVDKSYFGGARKGRRGPGRGYCAGKRGDPVIVPLLIGIYFSGILATAEMKATPDQCPWDTVVVANCAAAKRAVIDYGDLRKRIQAARVID